MVAATARPLLPPTAAPPVRWRGSLAARAGAVAVAGLLAAVLWSGRPGGASLVATGPATPAGAGSAGAPAPDAHGYLVRPGDTLWSIARRLQPTGDVRPLVARLGAERGGRPLQVGERIVLPGPADRPGLTATGG